MMNPSGMSSPDPPAPYGWSPELSDEEILEKLVALNAERAAEEAQGLVRWLRPEYQAPDEVATQAQAVRAVLVALAGPVTSKQVAAAFKGARTARITELLETLASPGQARAVEEDRFVGQ